MATGMDTLYRRAYQGVNYRLRNVLGGRLADYTRPTSIIFLLTELCSAKCVHCDIWKNRGREDSPSADQWKQVVGDLRSWLGPVGVTISGGEALMKPFAIDVVAHAHKVGIPLEILTHGYWADQRKIEALAMAQPNRVTLSLDGMGETHNKVRGKERFWDFTTMTLATLKRMRQEHGLKYTIRLKNVIMSYNLVDTVKMAHYAAENGFEIFYQPIEQNYNTPEDEEWWLHTENWPKDTKLAVANVKELIKLKGEGLPIRNSIAQLEAMIPYFDDVAAHRLTVQAHAGHEKVASCSALTMLQIQANGDVTVCTGAPPVGNIKETPIREIWAQRPKLWRQGCCMEKRLTKDELHTIELAPSLTAAKSWKQ
jgi:MoaA/NifB/PqqE/SkfB family radical SAM enzyme